MKHKIFNQTNFLFALYSLFVISIFFPLRKVLISPAAYSTGAYSDFTSFSIYSIDILLALLCVLIFWQNRKIFKLSKILSILAIWLVFLLFMGNFVYFDLKIYFTIKFLELIVLHETLANSKLHLKQITAYLFAILGVFQSIIAFLQILTQGPLGLHLVGEQHIGPQVLGVAKVSISGFTFLRGYGTFPHSNILSAFLLVSVVFSFYLWAKSENVYKRFIWVFVALINIFGLFISFSRAGITALAVSIFSLLVISLIFKRNIKKSSYILGIFAITTIACSTVFFPLLAARSNLYTDNSTKERVYYTKIGLNMVKNNFLLGVGAGKSVLKMEDFSPDILRPWEKQPIHNYYLIFAAEFGIIGLFIILYFIYKKIESILTYIKQTDSMFNVNLFAILVGFLFLMFFDHYFYTIEQGQMLLWLIFGLISLEIRNAKEKT